MKKVEKKEQVALTSRLYEIVRRPVITEKTMKMSESSQVVFLVAKDATKTEIKQAVEGLFGVKVKAVNTLCIGGKTKVFRGKKGQRSDVKKAIVSLEKGQTIDMTTGI